MAKTIEKARHFSFPIWLTKYPSSHDVDNVYSIPVETLESFPPIFREKILGRKVDHPDWTRKLANRPYFRKYRLHPGDRSSSLIEIRGLVGRMMMYENHLVKSEDILIKRGHLTRLTRLSNKLQNMKFNDFPKYWRIMQDQKLWDIVQDNHQGMIDLGAFVNADHASRYKVVGADSYIDTDTLYGCEETGETRFAVSRRLGKLWEPGMQVYIKDIRDGLWKMAEVDSTDSDFKSCSVTLLATYHVIKDVKWEDMKPFDTYATSRPMDASNPIRGEEAARRSREIHLDNLKVTDPSAYEQEMYSHICDKYDFFLFFLFHSYILSLITKHNRYYNGKAPTGSFEGWRERFMTYDLSNKSDKRIRWIHGLSKYMQRRVYLKYPVRVETFESGRGGTEEPWWVQHVSPTVRGV